VKHNFFFFLFLLFFFLSSPFSLPLFFFFFNEWVFNTTHLTLVQWSLCIGVSLFSIPVGFFCRLFHCEVQSFSVEPAVVVEDKDGEIKLSSIEGGGSGGGGGGCGEDKVFPFEEFEEEGGRPGRSIPTPS
jgi:hypothetical protein